MTTFPGQRPDASTSAIVSSASLLLVARVEDCRAVARAAIVALPIEGRRVVNLEEELQKCRRGYFLGIVNDLDGFGVAVVIAIGGIRRLPPV